MSRRMALSFANRDSEKVDKSIILGFFREHQYSMSTALYLLDVTFLSFMRNMFRCDCLRVRFIFLDHSAKKI